MDDRPYFVFVTKDKEKAVAWRRVKPARHVSEVGEE